MTAPVRATLPRAAVVVNATKSASSRLRRLVDREAERVGWGATLWFETSAEDPGQGMARQALAEGVQLVIAAGGDGTVRAVAEVLRGTGVSMAVIPLGTGNLFAHNLAMGTLPVAPVVLGVAQAVRTAFSGHDRAVDMGVIELERPDGSRSEHAFLVLAGIGIDAQMIANTNPELKKRLGVLAYVEAIARSLRDSRRIRLHASLDGAPERALTVHSLLIGNCGYLPGNIPLLPDARLDDGDLDIVSFLPEGFFGWLRLSFAMFWRNIVMLRGRRTRRKLVAATRKVRGLRYQQGLRLVVRLDEPDDLEMDGDHFGLVSGFTAQVDPGALHVRVADSPRFAGFAVSPARRRGSRAASRAPR